MVPAGIEAYNRLSANTAKWSNTLKAGELFECVLDHFVRLAPNGLSYFRRLTILQKGLKTATPA